LRVKAGEEPDLRTATETGPALHRDRIFQFFDFCRIQNGTGVERMPIKENCPESKAFRYRMFDNRFSHPL